MAKVLALVFLLIAASYAQSTQGKGPIDGNSQLRRGIVQVTRCDDVTQPCKVYAGPGNDLEGTLLAQFSFPTFNRRDHHLDDWYFLTGPAFSPLASNGAPQCSPEFIYNIPVSLFPFLKSSDTTPQFENFNVYVELTVDLDEVQLCKSLHINDNGGYRLCVKSYDGRSAPSALSNSCARGCVVTNNFNEHIVNANQNWAMIGCRVWYNNNAFAIQAETFTGSSSTLSVFFATAFTALVALLL